MSEINQKEPETIIPKDTQYRDWLFTVNNPTLSEREMFNYLKTLTRVRYFIFTREKGDQGTEHHQGYIEFSAPKKFSTMKNYFSQERIGVNAHISMREYSRESCVEYVKKTGPYINKAHTRISDYYEYGKFSNSGTRNDLTELVDMSANGESPIKLFEHNPSSYARYQNFIDRMGLEYREELYKTTYRSMEVYYIYGPTRIGKTRYVYEKYGYKNVYCNQGYEHGKWFDGYNGEDVLLLDEFNGNIEFGLLLQYLDGHPITIQCRYKNKQACYTKVYIVSNIGLRKQYPNVQENSPERWNALVARLTAVYAFKKDKDEKPFITECFLPPFYLDTNKRKKKDKSEKSPNIF